jgi:hypothetical protein
MDAKTAARTPWHASQRHGLGEPFHPSPHNVRAAMDHRVEPGDDENSAPGDDGKGPRTASVMPWVWDPSPRAIT